MIPLVFINVVRKFLDVINIVFLGKYNNPAMIAGVGIGSITSSFLGLAIILGFNSALDTLVSNSAGAKQHYLSGRYLN